MKTGKLLTAWPASWLAKIRLAEKLEAAVDDLAPCDRNSQLHARLMSRAGILRYAAKIGGAR